jgi:hypothetical protein
VIERLSRAVALPLLGHLGLVLAIVADYYRRASEGGLSMLLSAVGLVALLIGGVIFVRYPRLFFFRSDDVAKLGHQPNGVIRLFAWALVVITPVLWFIAIDKLPNVIPSELVMRLVAAYVFFAWVAGAIIVSPYLFGRRREP